MMRASGRGGTFFFKYLWLARVLHQEGPPSIVGMPLVVYSSGYCILSMEIHC